jgi:hypothetical protein
MGVYKMEEQNTPVVLNRIREKFRRLQSRFERDITEIPGFGIFLQPDSDITEAMRLIRSSKEELLAQFEKLDVNTYQLFMHQLDGLEDMYDIASRRGDVSNAVKENLSSVIEAMHTKPTIIDIKSLCDFMERCNSAQTLLSISGDSVGSDYNELISKCEAAKRFTSERMVATCNHVVQLTSDARQLLQNAKAGSISCTELRKRIQDISRSAPFFISSNRRVRYPGNIELASNDLKQELDRLVKTMLELRAEQHKQEIIQPETEEYANDITDESDTAVTEEESASDIIADDTSIQQEEAMKPQQPETEEYVNGTIDESDTHVVEKEETEPQQPEVTNAPTDTVDTNAVAVGEVKDAHGAAIHQSDTQVVEKEEIESQQHEVTNVPTDTTVDTNVAAVDKVKDAHDVAIHQDELWQHHTIVAVDQIEEPNAFIRFIRMILNLLFSHPNPNSSTPDLDPDLEKQRTEVKRQLEDTQELSDVVGELGQLEQIM